uniref:Glutamate--cysteine ligase n=1 Tax=Aureoumbra lagunensis TaxID=44058 RepID=A0A7S3JZB8_9STRA|mmetsp:Transcript_15216/g.20128  ORF Transcript_15216/g.20128 Transcript_15216/m.20128 type:complete len:814 (-) Transcript_15216:669-3110(-)|eukprot:CAMPEP_0197302026 /NCGR_PEP_ID=MMETSP0890-20130614/50782_1 /TAXON_ID=44058 ORGANISM="Aureoumbra lagunensis, Strain CCMP1510" /NCGR_SAMPLE_ID=MMETSP0890 /ASSEMBLY_ACC=CAM_ASM_000533 /LENGTH=813 /DNA_ID=CAMNT_0042781507 /DNA_START=1173 /DNA_END=3614 /DNA_ORIENTATION=+
MGVLTVGEPLKWEDSLDKLEYVRRHGVLQFINHYKKYKDISKDVLFYGDEIEYGLFRMDHDDRKPYLCLRAAEVRALLEEREVEEKFGAAEAGKCTWHPEYGSWMVESTPADPYSGFTADLRRVETNMRARRARLLAALNDDEIAPTIVVFPLLGVGNSADDKQKTYKKCGPIAASDMVPDIVINPHPRFGALTKNIRQRRGSKVKIEMPMYQDEKTREKKIEMDAMAFGMGCCCLQVTFQCRDLAESRHIYDQLVVIAPIMLALTAATPIMAGKLSDLDVRWKAIEMSVDDRTPAERGEQGKDDRDMKKFAGKGQQRLRTSRYSGVNSYICPHKQRCDLHCAARHYNDVNIELDEQTLNILKKAGVDDLLAQHVAHLFVRDPLVIFNGMIESINDEEHTDHFENIQSTNWNSVRWKPPPSPNPHDIGWRVELRTMEVQLTDFENAAYTVFAVLLLRVLLSFDLNTYMPMSKVHENMEKAHDRNAATKDKYFWWRSHLAYPKSAVECHAAKKGETCRVHENYERLERMSILEILTGKQPYYPGLVPIILAYLTHIGCDPETERIVRGYLDLIVKRASGELMTAATWMRNFVESHADYQKDSIVQSSIAYDLLMACHEIGVGRIYVPELLGVEPIAPIVKENAYNIQLRRLLWENNDSKNDDDDDKLNTLQSILDRYAERARLLERKNIIIAHLITKRAEIADLENELHAIDLELEPTNVSRPPSNMNNGSPALNGGGFNDSTNSFASLHSANTYDGLPPSLATLGGSSSIRHSNSGADLKTLLAITNSYRSGLSSSGNSMSAAPPRNRATHSA